MNNASLTLEEQLIQQRRLIYEMDKHYQKQVEYLNEQLQKAKEKKKIISSPNSAQQSPIKSPSKSPTKSQTLPPLHSKKP